MSGKKLPFLARFGIAVLSFVLGLLLFASAVVTLLIADVRIITSENNVRQLTKLALGSPQRVHSVVSVHRGAVGVPYAAGPKMEEEGQATNSAVTDGLVGFLYQGLKDYLGDDMTMTQEELEAVVEQSTVKDFIADKASSLVTDYIVGEVTTTIDGEELKELIQENQELIEQVVGEPLPPEVVEQIVEVVETNEVVQKLEEEGLAGFIEELGGALPEGGEGLEDSLGGILKPKDPNALGNQMGEIFGDEEIGEAIGNISSTVTGGELEGLGSISDVFTVLRAVTSVSKLVIGIVVCLVLMALILLVNIKQLNKGLRRCGLPLIFAGFLFIADLVAIFVPSLFVGMEFQLVRQILVMTATANGVAFGLGLLLVIAGFVVGSVSKKRVSVAAAQPAFATVGAPAEMIVEVPEETPVEASQEEPEEEAAAEVGEESSEEMPEEIAEDSEEKPKSEAEEN